MTNPYQSTNTKLPAIHNDKATAKELLIIIAVLIIASLAYGYYRKAHEVPNEPVPVASTSGATSNMNNPETNSNAVNQ